MTISRTTLSEIRFGYGFRPGQRPHDGPDALMAALAEPDPNAADHGYSSYEDRFAVIRASNEARRARREEAENAQDLIRRARRSIQKTRAQDLKLILRAPMLTETAFRERLLAFWADHFTVSGRDIRTKILIPHMIQTALRPHITGRFTDMLIAANTHPAMLHYLDQSSSFGPNSPAGQRRERGLNENLAREILELHTLGVEGAYTQGDVREFAELLTGTTYDKNGFIFRPRMAEPGSETVLGQTYGTFDKGFDAVKAALTDISLHPDTARHLATKLVVHFVGAPADPGHVAAVQTAFQDSEGALMPTYRALLEHPAAWTPELRKVKPPFDYIVSALRAFGVSEREINSASWQNLRNDVLEPLRSMGQPFQEPPGPDGWSETPEDWITPAGLSERILWANTMTQRLGGNAEPRDFLQAVLHDAVTPELALAVERAESKPAGLAITLASPQFNRR